MGVGGARFGGMKALSFNPQGSRGQNELHLKRVTFLVPGYWRS